MKTKSKKTSPGITSLSWSRMSRRTLALANVTRDMIALQDSINHALKIGVKKGQLFNALTRIIPPKS